MRTRARLARKAVACGIVCVGGFVAFGLHGKAGAPADADVFVVQGHLLLGGALSTPVATVTYSVESDVQCAPHPVGVVTVPGFIDASGSDSGDCSVGGNGSLTLAECTTGVMYANDWELSEPSSGTSASFSGAGVVVGGVAVLAAPPAAGLGYTDDGSTGAGVLIGTITAPSFPLCDGKATQMALTAVVAGVY